MQPAIARPFHTTSFHGSGEGDAQETKQNVSPKVVVFGGSGYVGSAVCKALLKLGINVTSVSRSGAPASASSEEWVQHVRWIKGDSLLPDLWKPELHDACGVVSTVGAFGSNDFMERACGDTMIEIAKAAAEAKVPRCVYISAHFYELPEFFLKGYVKGKRKGEAAVKEFFPDSGVCLRPGFIHGTRNVGSMKIPLSIVGGPLEMLTRNTATLSLTNAVPQLGLALCPPTKVEDVGAAAARAASDSSVPAGVISAWDIPKYAI